MTTVRVTRELDLVTDQLQCYCYSQCYCTFTLGGDESLMLPEVCLLPLLRLLLLCEGMYTAEILTKKCKICTIYVLPLWLKYELSLEVYKFISFSSIF